MAKDRHSPEAPDEPEQQLPALPVGRAQPPRAKVALRYVSDQEPGFTRVRRGKAFAYRQPDGQLLTDPSHLARIKALAIPPAYREVWICARPEGHLQATGRDARGRKQYRYHPLWQQQRDAQKFERMAAFGQVLPKIRARVVRDLKQFERNAKVTRVVVLATVVRLLDTTLVRVGNEVYRRDNGSYGLTTLRERHAAVRQGTLQLRFKGKSGVLHEVSVDDRRLARIVRRCQSLPGHELFHYVDEQGRVCPISSDDVNDYLRDIAGAEYSAKDFRTWHATVNALSLSCEACATCHEPGAERQPLTRILAEVACRLGNTPAVCRKSYVHPRVLELGGLMASHPQEAARIAARMAASKAKTPARHFSVEERRLLTFLRSSACLARLK